MFFGNKVKLRGLELSDVDNIMKNWNDLEVRQYLFNVIPASREEEIEWIKSTWIARSRGRQYVFSIETLDGVWLGTCGLSSINNITRSAVLGIAIHRKDQWGRGFGTDAVITLCSFGFNILNLNRIELEYYESNKRGANVYPKAGFKIIGRRREARYADGVYEDSIMMDVLRSEFYELFPDLTILKK